MYTCITQCYRLPTECSTIRFIQSFLADIHSSFVDKHRSFLADIHSSFGDIDRSLLADIHSSFVDMHRSFFMYNKT